MNLHEPEERASVLTNDDIRIDDLQGAIEDVILTTRMN